jgi:hypothetical protein
MSNYYSFSEEAVQNAIHAAKSTHEAQSEEKGAVKIHARNAGSLCVSAECISIVVKDGKVCVELPLGFGKICLSIPSSIPSGTAGQACLSICTTWPGIPTGVRVTVVIAGVTVVNQAFGVGC